MTWMKRYGFVGGIIVLVVVVLAVTIGVTMAMSDDDSTSTATTSTTTPPAAAPATSAAPAQLTLGQDTQIPDGTATALEVQQDFTSVGTAPTGSRWATAKVRSCTNAGTQPHTAGARDWLLLDANGGRYPASSTGYEDFPRPQYPFGSEDVPAGECVEGWVVFPVAEGVTIDRVRYAPTSGGQTYGTWGV